MPRAVATVRVDEPTLQMAFGVNTSPLSGREGTWSTSRKLRERLFKELETNVSLRVIESESPDTFLVSGRGELHLAILIETMRREGYELQVSQPEVIFHQDEEGRRTEPYERVEIEVAEEYQGVVVEQLGQRKGEMLDMRLGSGSVFFSYVVPTRGLLGFRNDFQRVIERDASGQPAVVTFTKHEFAVNRILQVDEPHHRANAAQFSRGGAKGRTHLNTFPVKLVDFFPNASFEVEIGSIQAANMPNRVDVRGAIEIVVAG